MGLYRNIAGFEGNERVGLSLYNPGLTIITDTGSPYPVLPSPFSDPAAYQQQQQAMQDANTAEMNSRYDWLMSHSYDEITAAGYYVTADTGSIFQWSDPSHLTSAAYLPIAEIQRIENERGTAGTLLLHMQQPAIAKDTAGFEGGSSATFYQQNGVNPDTQVVADPIPQVQALPPVTTTTVPATAATTTTTHSTAATATTPKNNFLALAILAGLGVVAIAGEPLLHKKKKIVFVGGLGALFYIMAKR